MSRQQPNFERLAFRDFIEGGHGGELVDQSEVHRINDWTSTDCGGVEYVWIVGGYRLRLRLALKRGNLSPKKI